MISTKHHTFDEYSKAEYAQGLEGQVATQLMHMYRLAKGLPNPVILELETDQGCSTTIFCRRAKKATVSWFL